jgi:peptidoglycan/xylan/chitin deacetylase (PgdA/CDA1 family)
MPDMPPLLARRVVKTSAALADRVRPPRRGVVVLLYHRIGATSGLEVDLPADLFEEQMAELAADARAVALDDALTRLRDPAVPKTDPVVVTFDDGTADFVDVALPILERHRVPAVLYVATDFVERGHEFPDHGTPASWAGLRDALSTGLVTIGSHTHTHALLDRVPVAEAEAELDRSRELIGERLGVTAEHFAYPKAVLGSPGAAAAVRERFRSAAVAGTRPNRYGTADPYRLTRSPIQVADGLRWFRRKAAGGMALEGALREALDRRRYAGRSA